jgi:hypothetical protein
MEMLNNSNLFNTKYRFGVASIHPTTLNYRAIQLASKRYSAQG